MNASKKYDFKYNFVVKTRTTGIRLFTKLMASLSIQLFNIF